MRIQCPRCNALAEVTRFTTLTEPPRIEFNCSACGEQVTEVASEQPKQPLGAPKDNEAGSAADRPDGSSVGPGRSTSGSEGPRGEERDALWNLWDRVTERFDDPPRHDAFIAACEVSDSLAFAAARYREWAESHPEDAISPERLRRISTLVQVKVLTLASRRPKEKDPVRQILVLGIILLLILAVVVLTAPLVFRGFAGQGGARGGDGLRGEEGGRPSAMEPSIVNLRRPPSPEPRSPAARPGPLRVPLPMPPETLPSRQSLDPRPAPGAARGAGASRDRALPLRSPE
ncbi:MAG: hypothetical protein RBU30_03275 [Polyangia bacterium]|jgi:hypothetical protein|nr:hypothetical protein [Polyangia bacterium]